MCSPPAAALEEPLADAPALELPAPLLDEHAPDDDPLALVPVTSTRLFTCDESSDALPSSV